MGNVNVKAEKTPVPLPKREDFQDKMMNTLRDILLRCKSLISKLNIPTAPPKKVQEDVKTPKKTVENEKIPLQQPEKPSVERKVMPPPPKPRGILIKREGRDEREKKLISWASHINPEGKTFEQCLECGKYTFLKADVTQTAIKFTCLRCGAEFTLKR